MLSRNASQNAKLGEHRGETDDETRVWSSLEQDPILSAKNKSEAYSVLGTDTVNHTDQ